MEQRKQHKWRTQDGVTPDYRAFHEVHVSMDLGAKRNEELEDFIAKHITEFKGHAEGKSGISLMLFDRKQDAQSFADILISKLGIQKEHITIKARKFTR
jgi:hypothetical protein